VFTAAWPFAYTIYAQVRGAFDGFYPYYFADPTRAPWSAVLLNLAGLMGAFVVAALLLVGLSHIGARRQPQI
jgi:hypothetical protein